MSQLRVIGIDLGGTLIRGVLADGAGQFLERRETETHAHQGPAAVVARIVSMVNELRTDAVAAIAVGAPGPIDSGAGVVTDPPNLPAWKNVPLASRVQAEIGVPAYLGNDANLAALGEFTFGAGRDVRHLIYMTVSTGVGGGIIVDGVLLEGQRGAGGEVGHMIVQPGGPRCSCGGYGHLESLVSGTAIARQAREALASGRTSSLTGASGNVTARRVAYAAAAGDALAMELLHQAGRNLGYAVTSLVHLFNPQMVAIGGGVSQAGELLMSPVRETVLGGLMPVFREDLQLVRASLGRDVGLYGAVALALRYCTQG